MRIALAFMIAACARSAHGPLETRRSALAAAWGEHAPETQDSPGAGPEQAEACDVARWQDRATSSLRGRIAGIDVIIAASGGGRSEVLARIGGDVLVGTEVSDDRLERVVTHETSIARAPAGPSLPGVLAEPGLAANGSGAWLAVHAEPPLEVVGFVPRAATGLVWQAHETAPTKGSSLPASSDVLAAPAFGAEQVASIAGGYAIVDRADAGPPGWLHVEAHTAGVRVAGWTVVPHVGALRNIYDFSDDTIEGELVRPDTRPPPPHAGPGCIRARPRDAAPILGVVTGTVTSSLVTGGWLELRFTAPWGRVVGYVRVDPSAAPRM